MSTYSKAKLRPFLGYIGLVRDSLRMQNWDIILHLEKCEDEDINAHTWQQNYHTTLNIQLGKNLLNETPERIRNAVVHELVHAQHRDVTVLWEGCTLQNTDVPRSQAKSWDKDYHMCMERFVSWITARVEPTVPDYEPKKTYPTLEGCYLNGEHIA